MIIFYLSLSILLFLTCFWFIILLYVVVLVYIIERVKWWFYHNLLNISHLVIEIFLVNNLQEIPWIAFKNWNTPQVDFFRRAYICIPYVSLLYICMLFMVLCVMWDEEINHLVVWSFANRSSLNYLIEAQGRNSTMWV